MTDKLSLDELKLRAQFFGESGDMYAISDMSGKIVDVNTAMQDTLGYTRDELIGHNWAQYMHEADQEASAREFSGLLKSGRSAAFMTRVRCKNGDYRLIEWHSRVSDVAQTIFSMGRDVTSARREYENLNGQVSLQRAIIDGTEFSIISTDEKGCIQTFNRHAERMLGYSKQETVGILTPLDFFDSSEVAKYTKELSSGFGEALGEGMDALLAKARAGLVEERDWTLVRKSKLSFPAHVSITALRNEFAQVYAFLLIVRDITEQRRVENLKNEFISTVSHELRTPMTSIRGSLGLIAGGIAGEIPKEAQPLIDIAISSTDRLIRLVNDMLDIEKIGSGKMQFNYSVVEMAPLIERAIESNRSFAEKHKVRFNFTRKIPNVKVKLDVDRFAQILDNLLSNAAKYTKEGDEIDVEMSQGLGGVRVSVIDHGTGIPESFRPKIFAKFMQANSTDKREKGGTGLGLAICKALIEQQGGSIDFASVEGRGTTFFFEFPVLNNNASVGGIS